MTAPDAVVHRRKDNAARNRCGANAVAVGAERVEADRHVRAVELEASEGKIDDWAGCKRGIKLDRGQIFGPHFNSGRSRNSVDHV